MPSLTDLIVESLPAAQDSHLDSARQALANRVVHAIVGTAPHPTLRSELTQLVTQAAAGESLPGELDRYRTALTNLPVDQLLGVE